MEWILGTHHTMIGVLAFMDFPQAPGLDIYGKLDKTKATPNELHGEVLFNGKTPCALCHAAPYYPDNNRHDLKVRIRARKQDFPTQGAYESVQKRVAGRSAALFAENLRPRTPHESVS